MYRVTYKLQHIYLNLLVLVLEMAAIGDQNLQPPVNMLHCLTSFIEEVNFLYFGVAICKRVGTLKMYSIFHGPMKRDLTLRTIKYRTCINVSRLGHDTFQQNV